MARDLFAEIGYQPETQPKASGPRDLFAEIGFDPATVKARALDRVIDNGPLGDIVDQYEREAAEIRPPRRDAPNRPSRAASTPDTSPASGRSGKKTPARETYNGEEIVDRPDRVTAVSSPLLDGVRSEGAVQGLVDRYNQEKITGSNAGSISAPRGPAPSVGSVTTGLGQSFVGGAELTKSGLEQASNDFLPLAPWETPEMRASQGRKLEQEGAAASDRIAQSTPEFESDTARGLYGGASSLTQMVPGIAASIATGNPLPGIAAASVQTGGQAYNKYKQRGATPGEAALGATLEGTVEGVGEILPMGSIVARFGKEGAAKFLADFFIKEMSTEQATTLAQDAIDTAIANPGKTWGDYLRERPDAAYQTALGVLVMSGTLGTASAGANYAARKIDERGRITARNPADTRTPPPGIRETAEQEAAIVTPEDEASPLDTGDIVAGRVEIAKAEAGSTADSALGAFGMPKVGTPVTIDYGDGTVEFGTMRDTFADETGAGVIIEREGGKTLREYNDTLTDAGVRITPREPAGSPAITVPVMTESVPIVPQAAPQRATPKATGPASPSGDGVAAIRSIFGDKVRVTSGYRGPDHPLSKKNPSSWHAKSRAAVDVAPIPGMTFEQAKARIEAQGYSLIEAINEVGKGRTKHATGDHWHFVIGEKGAAAASAAPGAGDGLASVPAPTPARDVEPMELAQPDFSGADASLLPEPTTQPDMLGGPDVSADELTARALAPQIVDEIERDETDAASVEEATRYLREAQPQERDQALAEFRQAIGRRDVSNYAEAMAIAERVDSLRFPKDAQRTGITPTPDVESVSDAPARPAESTVEVADTLAGGMPLAKAAAVARGDATPAPRSQVSVVDTGTGKSVAIMGATADDLARVAAAIPNAKPVKRKDGATVYSKKYADRIRDVLAGDANPVTPAERAAVADRGEEWRRPDGTLTPLDFDTRPRDERVRIMEAAGVNSAMLAGGPKRNSATPFDELPERVKQRIHLHLSIGEPDAKKPEGERQRAEGLPSPWQMTEDGEAPAAAPPARSKQDALKAKSKSRSAAAAGDTKLRDWSGTIINGYDGDPSDERGMSGTSKKTFLDDARAYLKAVDRILELEGFAGQESKPNRNGKTKTQETVRVSEGGPAVSGDVYYEAYLPDGRGVYVNIGTALAGPNGGASLMARTVTRGQSQSGQNQWWPVTLSATELADRLRKLAESAKPAAQSKPDQKSDLLEAAKASGRLEIVDTRTPAKKAWRNPEAFIRIAADDVSALRKVDVERVIREAPAESRGKLAEYISSNRSDLVEEVRDVLDELSAAPVEDSKPDQKSDLIEAAKASGRLEIIDTRTPAKRRESDYSREEFEAARTAARAAGAKAWASGDRRTPAPSGLASKGADNPFSLDLRADWYAGWDSANLAAPIEGDAQYRADMLAADNPNTVIEAARTTGANYPSPDTRLIEAAKASGRLEIIDTRTPAKTVSTAPSNSYAEPAIIKQLRDLGVELAQVEKAKAELEAGDPELARDLKRITIDGLKEQYQSMMADGAVAGDVALAKIAERLRAVGENIPAEESKPDQETRPDPKPADYGANNRLVTQERAEELRKRLKEKLNRLNAGIDPEILAIGTELAVFHIEAGARRFRDLARAIAADLDQPVADLRRYLRGWYNGARDMMEDSGESVAGMDDADEVGRAMRTFTDWGNSGNESVDAAIPNRLRESDARGSAEDVSRDAPDRRTGSAPGPEGRGSEASLSAVDGSGPRGNTGRGSGSDRAGLRDADNLPARERDAGSVTPARAAGAVTGTDWLIEPGSLDEGRSFAVKARDNVEAIALVKQIEREGRPATRDEQAKIAKYVGWGGLKNAFPDTQGNYGKGFEEIGPRLRELLTDKEYETANRSIQYAHYTGETVVRAMWGMAEKLGFKGGTVFEPGMGTGNFRGMIPPSLVRATHYEGLEYDHLTASIAKLLYPQSGVRQADYTRVPMVKNAVDLVIGNPPFSDTTISSDPEYGKHKFVLHDFFFAKSLDAVKPGGLLMFVTSAGTMNKKDTKARQYLADRADLVGAIRLPGNAFEKNAGTSVTTDIVILRKRAEGEASGDTSWVKTVDLTLPDRDGNPHTGSVNRYFAEHPEMVLGEQGFFDKLVAGPRYGVRAPDGFDLVAALKDAAANLPGAVVDSEPKALPPSYTPPNVDFGSGQSKDGSYYVGSDGRLMQYRGGVGRPVEAPGKGVKGGISKANQEKIKGLVPIRDALREVYAADVREDGPAGDAARKKLNAAYDKFVAKYGPLNLTETTYRRPSVVEMESLRADAREEARLAGREWDDGSFDVEPFLARAASLSEIASARKEARQAAERAGETWSEGSFNPDDVEDKIIEKFPNLDPFSDDEESYRLAAIEHYDKFTGKAKKGRAFTANAIKLDAVPQISSPQDALLYSLNRLGRPDLSMIADMAGITQSEALEKLADQLYEVPEAPGTYETAEMYLSGNVREKLATARAAAERNPDLARNVRALEAAQPVPLTPSEIAANLGMPWIPTDVVEAFAGQALGLTSPTVKYVPKLAIWSARGNARTAAATSEWGTDRMDAFSLIEAALNRQTPQVFDRTQDGGRVLNTVETQAAQDKMAAIKQAFTDWIWKDDARATRLVNLYNENFNSLVAPRFDGSYLTTPGINAEWSWRPHQRSVIARIIQAGNTYMAHEVGAGKTSAMIGAGMEMKRLGLVNKPMYVVPNHMLGQFTKEFYEQYPLAQIRVADERRFHSSRRKEFVAQVAADDLDAIIITHSAFKYIPMSDEFMDGLIADQVAELDELLAEIGKSQEDRLTRSKVQNQKEKLEQRLAGRKKKKADQVFTFEEMGVDFLFVDEAHIFRKLDYATKMSQIKGISAEGSQASLDLYAKTRYLEQQKPGRNLVLASGTPITNTMAELYSISRYLQQGELDKRQLSHFDAWAGAFGTAVTGLEQEPDGSYKSQTRFAEFVNVPELSVMVRQVMDVVGSAELRQYVSLPTLKGGSRQLVNVEETENQANYRLGELSAMLKAVRNRKGKPEKGEPIVPTVALYGRMAAIDYRLIDSTAPREDGSKLETLIDKVAANHKAFARVPFHQPLPEGKGFSAEPVSHGAATQMIFANLGINGNLPVHKYIKQQLIRRGVAEREVALISDYKSHVAKQRLFNDMNEGKVRILIGSVSAMGTGVNAQKRLRAVHNMDAMWLPAEDTQRNGRIIRQGNMNPEIEIFDYATKGTYDSTMWATMARKAKFIEGFMRGDPSMRDMEDLGEASAYEQAAAMTTRDPRILELTDWKQELEKVQRQKIAHERSIQSAKLTIASAEDTIATNEQRIPLIRQDIATRALPEKDAFTGKVGKETFDDATEFGEAILAAVNAVAEKAGSSEIREGIGEFAGFALVAEFRPRIGMEIVVKRAGKRETLVRPSEDARGTVTRIENVLKKFESEIADAEARIARAKQEIADFTPRLSQAFDKADKITELRDKIGELEATLSAETKAAEAAAAASAHAAPESEPKMSLPRDVDLPLVATLRGDEVATAPDIQGRRDQVVAWYKRTLRPKTVTASDGVKVRFGSPTVSKLHTAGDQILAAFAAVEKIISDGVYLGDSPPSPKWAARGVIKAHQYGARISVGGVVGDYGVVVHELADGRRYYYINDMPDPFGDAGSRSSPTEGPAKQSLPREVTPDAGINLFRLPDGRKGEDDTAAQNDAGLARLQDELRKLGLANKVAVRLLDTMGGSNGGYIASLIIVARDGDDTPIFTLHHEAVHALRDMGVFSPADWALLVAKAKRTPGMMRQINRRYLPLFRQQKMTGEQMEDALNEEAVADLFAMWQRGDYEAKGTIERLFQRLRGILDAIKAAFGQQRERTGDDVLREIADGTMGARAEAFTSGGAKGQVRRTFGRKMSEARDDMVELGATSDTTRGKMGEAFDKWRTVMQDRYLPLLKVQREIEQQTGQALPNHLNPYLGEELMTGRIGAQLEKLSEDMVAPLFDAMAEEGINTEALESYLYARHAPERNARIAEINPDLPDGGSGMTDLEARAILNRIEREGKTEAMERLARRVDAIRDFSVDYRVESGLMSEEQAAEWRDTYEHYVPLRGFAETEGDPAAAERINRSGGGINVRGKESKQAFGRRSKADSPLAYLILQAEEAVVRGETNRVAQRFVKLAQANPSDGFWKVQKSTYKRRINEDTGLVEEYLTHNLTAEDKDYTVTAKFDGKERRVTMDRSNPAARRLADSMRNLTQHQMDWVTLHLGKVNRFLSSVNTSYNPEFVITNAFRDLQTATINMAGLDVKGLTAGTLRDYPAALKAAMKGAFRKGDGEWRRWHDEFIEAGGRVSFNQVEDVTAIKKRIENSFAMAAAKRGEGDARLHAKRALFAARDLIESLNSGVENAVRLSAFKNARQRGVPVEQAASIAKNLTVNFNRRGTAGPALNAAYLFFNASVQGSTRIFQAMRSPKVRKILAGVVVLGFAIELLNAMTAGDDDDGENFYDKVPDYEKERNLIVMMPGGEYVKIPLPYGYNAFFGSGRSIAEIMRRGGKGWQETMGNWAGMVADAFNPIGGTNSLLNFISPTVIDPIVDLTLNRDFADKPIMPDQSPYDSPTPDNQRYWGSIAPHWKAVTDFLNEATGGDKVVPGAIDVSPATLEYLSGVVVGAAGAFADRIAGMVSKGLDPATDLETNDFVMVRKVLGDKAGWYDKSAYYDRMETFDLHFDRTKDYLDAEMVDEARSYASDHAAILSLELEAKAAQKAMKAVRKERKGLNHAHDLGKLTDAQYRQGLDIVKAQEDAVVKGFNTAWIAAMKQDE